MANTWVCFLKCTSTIWAASSIRSVLVERARARTDNQRFKRAIGHQRERRRISSRIQIDSGTGQLTVADLRRRSAA